MKSILNKIFFLSALTILCYSNLQAQYGNEWINYSRTYYKIKVGKAGIYRIPQSTLAAAGLGSVPGSQYTLYRNGQELPIFVSTSSTFGSTDYIEFYGTIADGKLDENLYYIPNTHPTDKYSLFTDTAVYYLTAFAGVHPRITAESFTLPSTLPSPEPYMMTEAVSNNGYKPTNFRAGKSYSSSHTVLKSTFDYSEGFVLNLINTSTKISNNNIALTKLYTGSSVPSSVEFSYSNQRNTTANLQFSVNSTIIKDTMLIGYGLLKKKFPVSSSTFTATTNIKSKDIASVSGFNIITIEYPRLFNYSTLTSTYTKFKVNPSFTNKYFYFTDITALSTAYLYDLTSNKRYTGVNNTATSTQYYIPAATSTREFVFVDNTEINIVANLETKNFTNYSNISLQGDYLILSHKGYISDPTNPIGNYANYRKSADGGVHEVSIIDVTELYDQFGYGNDYNPVAIKRFLSFANDTWTKKPQFLFIIGKGLLYHLYPQYLSNPSAYSYSNLVPTFGNPGSDNLLVDFDNDNKPDLAVGRLSAWNTEDINKYLEKVKAYEAAIKPAATPNLENTLWKKNALFIAGSNESDQASFILPSYTIAENYFKDTLMGGFVTTIKKTTLGLSDEETDDAVIKARLLKGVNSFAFYGHAYSTGFDYNLNNPDELVSAPRYPNFIAMGCNVSQIYETNHTISEDYLNSELGGSMSIIASNTLGYPFYLSTYLENFYKTISYTQFSKTLGEQYAYNIQSMPGSPTEDLRTVHLQNIFLQGDPGLQVFAPEHPDYYIDNTLLTSSVNPLNTGIDSSIITAVIYNLGSVRYDSVDVTIEHHKPNGTIIYLPDTVRTIIKTMDTFRFVVHYDNMEDVGMNKIIVKVNPSSEVEEVSYSQNTATLNLLMASDALLPTYPYEFSIVHNTPLVLHASSLNVFKDSQDYIIQIDTTELFNSPFKKEQVFNKKLGGNVTWAPSITMTDSQVYYWRTAVGNVETDSTPWTYSSFIYLKDGLDGWNQSHYFQFAKNKPYLNLKLEETDRKFKFGNITNEVIVFNRIYSDANPIPSDVRTLINNNEVDKLGCNLQGTIKFILIDPETAEAFTNTGGQYNSVPVCLDTRNTKQFEFSLKNATWRKRAADFIDSIPEGYYVIVTNYLYDLGGYWTGTTVGDWAGDTALYGTSNTLYAKLKSIGFEQIDSFNRKRVFTFVTKKGDPSFTNITKFSNDLEEMITVNFNILTKAKHGRMHSVDVGPTMKWQALFWDVSYPFGNPENDSNYVEVYGIKSDNSDTILKATNAKTVSLLDIDPVQYSRLRLVWYTSDSLNKTSSSLKYWRIIHNPLPEAALNPNRLLVKANDTIFEGQKLNFEVGIDNISNYSFEDSMLVHYTITKLDGTSELINTHKVKRLSKFDSAVSKLSFDPRNYPGLNTIIIEANPNDDQPELYHPNNFGYFTFYTKKDSTNPVLDVTFDGIHILDRDIVSAKPFIKIFLKDENLNSSLSDTATIEVFLLRPGSTTPEYVPLDGVIAKFNPNSSITKNEASIDYLPHLKKDGLYKLIVKAKDIAGNTAGSTPSYEIQFMVENKPTVTNLLNYPNPFSTSTAFVFTLTGSEIPQQFKIQILTVTGKVVREITRQELGPIHIGRNITEYKWDGTDQFGQKLGNGVYLYRLVTGLNGNAVEHRENEFIDKYFNKSGYGKMYIMR